MTAGNAACQRNNSLIRHPYLLNVVKSGRGTREGGIEDGDHRLGPIAESQSGTIEEAIDEELGRVVVKLLHIDGRNFPAM